MCFLTFFWNLGTKKFKALTFSLNDKSDRSFELKVPTYFEFLRLKFKVRKYSVEWADFVSRSS